MTRIETVRQVWNSIPPSPRTALVNELDMLCRDAMIPDGQATVPLNTQNSLTSNLSNVEEFEAMSNNQRRKLDDRAIRDAFLRFFCTVLSGYERHLVVPDADFMISGNEWFDTQGNQHSIQRSFAKRRSV